MSTILKALKKIEKESSQNIDVAAVSPDMNSTQVLKRRIKQRRSLPLFFVSSAAVIAALFCVWLVTDDKLPPDHTFSVPKISSDETDPSVHGTPPGGSVVQKKTVPMVTDETRVPNARFAESPNQRRETFFPTHKQPARQAVSSRRPLPALQPRRTEGNNLIRSSSAAVNVSPKVDCSSDPLPPDDIQSEIPLPAVKRVKAEDQTQPAPDKIADESWLRLQAISWSSEPQSRMAVINDRIVREGAAVDGGLVYRIDKDYVVVRKGGEEWQIKFGLK